MYVLMDGFVLGIGILSLFAEDEPQLDHMMTTAAPIWDGNETWLVLGGAGLLAAFPKAYAVMLSALYLPVLLMLVALVLRGVSFEFRFKATTSKRIWGVCFAAGSIAAAFAQGLMLGAIVEGMPLQGGKYLGGAFAWFSPFSMLTAVAVVFGYALLGSTWLIMKTGRRAAERRVHADAAAGRGRRRVHGAGQHLAAVPQQPGDGALVRKRQFPVAVAGAAAGARECGVAVAGSHAARRLRALHPGADVLRAGLRRTGAGDLAEPVAAGPDVSGRRRPRLRARASCSPAR